MLDFTANIFKQAVSEIAGWTENPVVLAAQIIAVFASLLNCLGFILRNRRAFLIDQVVVNSAYGVQYFLLGGISAVANNVLNIVKLIILNGYEKQKKNTPKWLVFAFCCISVIVGCITFDGTVLSAIPPFVAIIYTLAVSSKNFVVWRCLLTVCSAMWLVYNFCIGAYIAALYSAIELVVCALMLVREIVKPPKDTADADCAQ